MQAFFLTILLMVSPVAQATVCAGIDVLGQLQVTEHVASQGARCFNPLGSPVAETRSRVTPGTKKSTGVRSTRYDDVIEEGALATGVDARLLHAVIHVESRYNHKARSSAGAIGLMQVMPDTGKRFGATNLLDPRQNVLAGASYLKWLMARFKGDITLVIAAYNAGEGAVERHGNAVPAFPETRAYVKRVLKRYALS